MAIELTDEEAEIAWKAVGHAEMDGFHEDGLIALRDKLKQHVRG